MTSIKRALRFSIAGLGVFLALLAQADPASDYVEHYTKALKGNPQSQVLIGKLLIEGPEPVQRDTAKGIQLLEKAVGAGSLEARRYLISAYLSGKFMAKSVPAALRLLQPLAEKDKEEAGRYLQIANGSSFSSASGNSLTCKLADKWYMQDGSFVEQKVDCVVAGQYDSSTPEQARSLVKARAASDPRALQRFVTISLANLRGAGVGADLNSVVTSSKSPEKDKTKILGDKGSPLVIKACAELVDDSAMEGPDRLGLCNLAVALGDKASQKIVAYRKLDGQKPFAFDAESAWAMLLSLAESDAGMRSDLMGRAIRQQNFSVLLRLVAMNRGQAPSDGQRAAFESLRSWLAGYKTDLSSLASPPERAWFCGEIFKLDAGFDPSVYAELERFLGDQQMRECMPVGELSLVDRERLRDERTKLPQRRSFDNAGPAGTNSVSAAVQNAGAGGGPSSLLKKPASATSTGASTNAAGGTEKEILKAAADYLIDGRCGDVAQLLAMNPGYLEKLAPMVSASDCAKSNLPISMALMDFEVKRGNYKAATEGSLDACGKGDLAGCQRVVEWFVEAKGKIAPADAQRAASTLLKNSQGASSAQKLALIDYAHVTKEPFLKDHLREDWLARMHFGERNPRATLRYVFFEMPSGLQRLVDRDRSRELCATFHKVASEAVGAVDSDIKAQLARTCAQ